MQLIEQIGKGGMGCVWLARTDDGRKAAVKQMNNQFVTDPRIRDYFMREAKAMQQLNHPNVVKLVGQPYADRAGNLFLPMEFVEGDTIEHIVRQNGHFAPEQAVRLMLPILETFTYIHSKGMVHRDIKPSNIMVRPDQSICVIDFGIAKDMKTTTGHTVGSRVGTDGYMSPEQVSATNIDHRTDIYSLGCLLHYMITGKHAFIKKQNNYETSLSIINDAFPSAQELVEGVSDALQAVIYKATDKNMLRRYQTADDFRRALKHLLPGEQQDVEITVGKKGCDINVPNVYVSSSHLTIRFTLPDCFELRDHSRNGTMVNGRYVHNDVYQIQYNPNPNSGQTQPVPSIYLAGKQECELPWSKVVRMTNELIANPPMNEVPDDAPDLQPIGTTPHIPTKENNKGETWILLVVMLSVVGGILWLINKDKLSEKENQRVLIGWFSGVCARLILIIILLSI